MDRQIALAKLIETADSLAFFAEEFVNAIKEGNNVRARTKMLFVEIDIEQYKKLREEHKKACHNV